MSIKGTPAPDTPVVVTCSTCDYRREYKGGWPAFRHEHPTTIEITTIRVPIAPILP